MSEQKFHNGDLVRVAKDLGPMMSHFTGDCEAIVQYSYADKYGGSNTDSYGLHLKGHGEVAWYHEWQLALIESGRGDLLKQWKDEEAADDAQKSDLDWIFAHGQEVIEKGYGASVEALAACFGLTNLWGSRGEGVVYYANAMATIRAATPFLAIGDKAAYLKTCEEYKARKAAQVSP